MNPMNPEPTRQPDDDATPAASPPRHGLNDGCRGQADRPICPPIATFRSGSEPHDGRTPFSLLASVFHLGDGDAGEWLWEAWRGGVGAAAGPRSLLGARVLGSGAWVGAVAGG